MSEREKITSAEAQALLNDMADMMHRPVHVMSDAEFECARDAALANLASANRTFGDHFKQLAPDEGSREAEEPQSHTLIADMTALPIGWRGNLTAGFEPVFAPEPTAEDRAVHSAIRALKAEPHGNRMGCAQWIEDEEA